MDCPVVDLAGLFKAIDESRVVTALLSSQGGTLALLAAWTLSWEFLVKPLGRLLRRATGGKNNDR